MVGHSAACTLAWVAADQRPDAVTGVALIGGFPTTDGEKYADFFEPVDGAMPFPGWEKFEGPDSDDMSAELKARSPRHASRCRSASPGASCTGPARPLRRTG